MRLEELKVYQVAMEIGEEIYEKAITWDYFDKKTIGGQVIRAADSIAANISEGYGRFTYKETKLFLYYARGSAHETKTWIVKAKSRNLFTQDKFEVLFSKIDFCIALINGLIKSIGTTSKT
jgi:four helix bundle protein